MLPLEGLRFQGPREAFTASEEITMHAPIHPIQSGRAKVGKGVGREGTPGLVVSAYCGEKSEGFKIIAGN